MKSNEIMALSAKRGGDGTDDDHDEEEWGDDGKWRRTKFCLSDEDFWEKEKTKIQKEEERRVEWK